MAGRIVWPRDALARMSDMREAGASWDAVGAAFGVGTSTALAFFRRGEAPDPTPPRPRSEARVEHDRAPLPAGHPNTWGLLLSRTPSLASISGVPYEELRR